MIFAYGVAKTAVAVKSTVSLGVAVGAGIVVKFMVSFDHKERRNGKNFWMD